MFWQVIRQVHFGNRLPSQHLQQLIAVYDLRYLNTQGLRLAEELLNWRRLDPVLVWVILDVLILDGLGDLRSFHLVSLFYAVGFRPLDLEVGLLDQVGAINCLILILDSLVWPEVVRGHRENSPGADLPASIPAVVHVSFVHDGLGPFVLLIEGFDVVLASLLVCLIHLVFADGDLHPVVIL